MGFWSKFFQIIVPVGKIAADIFVKNPKSKEVVKVVEKVVDQIPPKS